jgi:small neutral amino acid transporter SnatA (MarC family)
MADKAKPPAPQDEIVKVATEIMPSSVPLLGPPAIGTVLIAAVLFDWGPSMVTRSAAVAATALVVGAVLILGSAALYCWRATPFEDFVKQYAAGPPSGRDGSDA